MLGKNSEVARKVAHLLGRYMDVEIPVSQFPLSVIAIFIYRVLIWLVFSSRKWCSKSSTAAAIRRELRWYFLGSFLHPGLFLNHHQFVTDVDLVFAGSGGSLGFRWYIWLGVRVCLLGKNSEVAWKVARFGRFMVPVSQFPLSVIAMFVLVFRWFR